MAIVYQCRHCSQLIARLEEPFVDASLLGLNQLTSKEKSEMLEYQPNGDLVIYTICECCEETLALHPHYHELDYFIQ